MNQPVSKQHVFLYSPEIERYSYPPEHPFKPDRARMTRDILLSHGLLSGEGRSEQACLPAERDVLEKFHTSRYLDVLIAAQAGKTGVEDLEMGLGTTDCPVFSGMYEYAALACGATLAGAELILSGQAKAVILQYAPGRKHFHLGDGNQYLIPSISEELELIKLYGATTLALTLHCENLEPKSIEEISNNLQSQLGVPVIDPLGQGVSSLIPLIREYIGKA